MNEVIARKWYSVAEAAVMLGYGVTKTKFLVLSGEISSVKDGIRRILPRGPVGHDSQRTEAAGQAARCLALLYFAAVRSTMKAGPWCGTGL